MGSQFASTMTVMNPDNYFLPPGYINNPVITFDATDNQYWNESRIAASRAYQAAAYQWAQEIIRAEHFETVADVGCGAASKLAALHQALPELETTGFDQPNAIAFCKTYHTFGTWQALDLDDTSFASDKKFDLIISSDVIEHLDNPDSLLNVLGTLAHAESKVLLTTPERVSLRGAGTLESGNAYHVREWSKPELAHYLEARGWQIESHKILPAFKISSGTFAKRALRRWLKGQSLRYNQAVLMRPPR